MRQRNRFLAVAITLPIAAGFATAGSLPAHAASFTVNSNSDGNQGTCGTLGVGTLRDCIGAANAAGGTNSISIDPSVTVPIVLGTGELHITGSPTQTLRIIGNGETSTIIDGNAASRVLEIDNGATVSLGSLTIRNGKFLNNSGSDGGGGIKDKGSLTIDHVTISGNEVLNGSATAANAGGILVSGAASLTVRNSTFGNNHANGGAAAAGGAIQDCCNAVARVAISDSDFSLNGSSTITGQADGGAIDSHSNLSIARSTFSENASGAFGFPFSGSARAGAISAHGALTIDLSSFQSNTANSEASSASGGAIGIGGGDVSTPRLMVSRSTFSLNTAYGNGYGGDGGAISSTADSAVIDSDTFDTNSALGFGQAFGGALWVDAQVTIVNSTFVGNATNPLNTSGPGPGRAPEEGGALSLNGPGSSADHSVLTNDTFNSNSSLSGANIAVINQTLEVRNTVISGSPSNNCVLQLGAVVANFGHNLEDAKMSTCGLTMAKRDILGRSPRLGPLAANGGPTETLALLPGSPGIDSADNAGCPTVDQRGFTRFPAGDPACDIGAFEVQVRVPGLPASGQPAMSGRPLLPRPPLLPSVPACALALAVTVFAGARTNPKRGRPRWR